MKSRFILLFTLAMSMTAYSMNLSWLGKLKPVVSRAASVACNYVKEHKVIAVGVGAVASAGAIAAIALYANKMYRQASPKKLWDDVVARNEHEVRVLLEAGVDPNIADVNYGETLLHAAVRSGNVAIVQLLCDYGANKEQTWYGLTPLYMAVERGYTDIVHALVQADAKKEALDRVGYTALHRAVRGGYSEIVSILVQAGANKEAEDSDGYTPLHVAVIRGNADIVSILVLAGANIEAVDRLGHTPLGLAVSNNNEEIVRILVQAGANLGSKIFGRIPLHHAVQNCYTEIVRILVQAGADIEADASIALLLAAASENHEIVGIMCQAGANIKCFDLNLAGQITARELIVSKEIISYLDQIPDLSELMRKAVCAGDIERVRGLLTLYAPILPDYIISSIRESNPQEPTQHDQIAGLLLKTIGLRRALRIKNDQGQTLLHVAAACGNVRIAAALLHNGAKVNVKDRRGNTPIHMARSDKMSRVLILHGAQLDVMNNAGQVPFSAQINQWMPWFRKWVEEDQKIPKLFTGAVQDS